VAIAKVDKVVLVFREYAWSSEDKAPRIWGSTLDEGIQNLIRKEIKG
jgi:hypothetical protein